MDTIPVLLSGGASDNFSPIVLSNWSLFGWMVLVFALLVIILTKVLWKPLLEVIDQREKRISGDIDAAEAARREAEELRAKHRTEMEAAASETKRMLEQARERAEKLQVELEAKAKVAADTLLENARRQIESDKAQALRDIREAVVELSCAVASQVIGKDASRGDYSAEADRLLAKVQETN